MSSTMRIIMKTIGLPLAAMASAVLANGVYAADVSTPPVNAIDTAQTPIEEVDKLDEIWVRGKRLSEVIEDAEDDFFRLYNKLSKNYEYDVFCGRMSLNSGSMIMIRKCVPGFIVTNYSDPYGRISDWGGGSGGFGFAGSSFGYGGYTQMGSYGMDGCCYGSGASYFPPPTIAIIQPPAEQMMMAKRPAYAANVLKVVTSDPRLLEKVKNLGVLYKDMELVQGRYVKVKGEGAPPPVSRKNRPIVGRRTL